VQKPRLHATHLLVPTDNNWCLLIVISLWGYFLLKETLRVLAHKTRQRTLPHRAGMLGKHTQYMIRVRSYLCVPPPSARLSDTSEAAAEAEEFCFSILPLLLKKSDYHPESICADAQSESPHHILISSFKLNISSRRLDGQTEEIGQNNRRAML